MRTLGNRQSLRPVRERAGHELLLGLQRQMVELWASDVLSHKEEVLWFKTNCSSLSKKKKGLEAVASPPWARFD